MMVKTLLSEYNGTGSVGSVGIKTKIYHGAGTGLVLLAWVCSERMMALLKCDNVQVF